jgi:hypothetical protein
VRAVCGGCQAAVRQGHLQVVKTPFSQTVEIQSIRRTPRAHRLSAALEAGSRKRNQPAPPRIVFRALTDRDPTRPWLDLLDVTDEQRPRLIAADDPSLAVWSSLWTKRPDAIVRIDLPADSSKHGTDLRWTLLVDEPTPDAALLGHLCKRLNQLINANLRYTFGGGQAGLSPEPV